MDGPMTTELAFALAGILVTTFVSSGLMWRAYYNKLQEFERLLRAEVRALERNHEAKILASRADHAALHLQVTREYASVQHLEKVESRLINAIDRLADKFEGVREALLARATGDSPHPPRPARD